MTSRNNVVLNILGVASLITAAGWLSLASAATKGDQNPYGAYGRVLVQAYDGGSGGRTTIPLKPYQNAVALTNLGILDGGTSQTIYCGYDTSLTPSNGFPVPVNATLSIDIVSLVQAPFPVPNDGGTQTQTPQLYCSAAAGALSEMDVRWMVVK